MLYDYLINEIYPKILWLSILSVITIIVVLTAYSCALDELNPNQKPAFIKKWRLRLTLVIISQVLLLILYICIPSKEYIVHYYGEGRAGESVRVQEQVEARMIKYRESQDKANEIFFKCLEKGQKQPHTTVFNDTNAVVQTCRKYANSQVTHSK